MYNPVRLHALREYIELQIKLQKEIDKGTRMSIVFSIQNMMDGPWDSMNEEERELARKISTMFDQARRESQWRLGDSF